MIPKIIHYCWFGKTEIPERFKKYISSWKKLCPDYEIIEWNESNYDVTKNTYMWQAYESKKWGFVPDYARLDIVYNYGGIYLDTDVEIVKPLDELLQLEAFAGEEACSKYVALGVGFGAEKGNEIIKSMLDCYENRNFILPNGEFDLLPSPAINTAPLYSIGFRWSDKIQELSLNKSQITIFPREYFCPIDYDTGESTLSEKTYMIHHYAGTWQSSESHEIRHLKEQYSKKYGRWLGNKLAKINYHYSKSGFKGLVKLCFKSTKNKSKIPISFLIFSLRFSKTNF